MTHASRSTPEPDQESIDTPASPVEIEHIHLPLTNYTLSTVCPSCGNDMFRLACKVRCGRCGFMWDCSEV